MKPQISINQFAEFTKSTESGKKKIIKQQITPSKYLIPWYQLSKSGMKKFFIDVNDNKPLLDTIQILKNRVPTTSRQKIDRKTSIEALEILLKMKMPAILKKQNYEIIRCENKSIEVTGLKYIIAPDVVIKTKMNGKNAYGAIKFHICKTKPFDADQVKHVSALLYLFIKNNIAASNELIPQELCLCLDVFGERFSEQQFNNKDEWETINGYSKEIMNLWTK